MSIMREIEERRSVRRYQDRPVTREQVLEVLEAGRLALSGSNTQPWRFLIIRDAEKKARIVKADADQQWMMEAPVFIACLADLKSRKHEAAIPENTLEDAPDNIVKLVIRDTAIAVGFMTLQAQHMGLATCWTGWFGQREMRDALGVSDDYYVSGILTLGYGAESPAQRPRLAMEELILEEDPE